MLVLVRLARELTHGGKCATLPCMSEKPQERLQKVLAAAGVASRRKAEELILQGRVTVNGRVVNQLGSRVDPAGDEIRVDGQRIQAAVRHTYILFNKPRGVLSTMEDDRGRRALGDVVSVPERVFPVGRLDATSEGLILLTDDGELANLLTHPRYQHDKEYRVQVQGRLSEQTLAAWRRGVMLEGELTAPAQVDVVKIDKEMTLLRVVMHEGRKRQIREVAALLGHPVVLLQRVRIGPLRLGTLPSGQWRYLTESELAELAALKQPPGRSLPRRARRVPPSRAARPPRRPPTDPADRPSKRSGDHPSKSPGDRPPKPSGRRQTKAKGDRPAKASGHKRSGRKPTRSK